MSSPHQSDFQVTEKLPHYASALSLIHKAKALCSGNKKSEFLLSPHLETASQMKKKLIVDSEVEIVDYNSLSRSERKIRKVFDTRIKDSIV